MTLITITLTQQEQELILGKITDEGQFSADAGLWKSIGAKILRTQAAEEAFRLSYELPESATCGLCGVSRESHDAADHHWQWLSKSPEPCHVCQVGRLAHREGNRDHPWQQVFNREGPDEWSPVAGDLPGEPAG